MWLHFILFEVWPPFPGSSTAQDYPRPPMEPRAFLPVSLGGTCGAWLSVWSVICHQQGCTRGPPLVLSQAAHRQAHPPVIKDFAWIHRQAGPSGVSKPGTKGSS